VLRTGGVNKTTPNYDGEVHTGIPYRLCYEETGQVGSVTYF